MMCDMEPILQVQGLVLNKWVGVRFKVRNRVRVSFRPFDTNLGLS